MLEQAVSELLTAVASGLVLGIASLLILYKMIDGEIPVGPGLATLTLLGLLVIVSVRPPHPYLPGVVLIVALTLMAGFPYAAAELARHEMRQIDTGQLDRAFQTFVARPDNVVARLQIAKGLYAMGFHNHAICAAQEALQKLDTTIDPVLNRSQRDLYREEDILLSKWVKAAQARPPKDGKLQCQGCKHINPVGALSCEKCGRTYLLDHVRNVNIMPRIYARLLGTWCIIAFTIVASAWIGLRLGGLLMIVAVLFMVACVGGVLYWLFRPPVPAR